MLVGGELFVRLPAGPVVEIDRSLMKAIPMLLAPLAGVGILVVSGIVMTAVVDHRHRVDHDLLLAY